jgi:hypothetical protein
VEALFTLMNRRAEARGGFHLGLAKAVERMSKWCRSDD